MRKRILLGLLVALLSMGTLYLYAQDDEGFTHAGDTEIPDFPEGLSWLNVDRPLTLDDLKGRVVLFDFWTYGCVNCMHVIPDLKRLEEEFGDNLLVVGVHSAKFENEGVTENIRQIALRYGVEHPIVNDTDFQIWQDFGVRAWPSLYLMDPLARFVGRLEGEGIYAPLQPIITTMIEEYGEAGLLDPKPLPIALESNNQADTALRFPGKVLADSAGGRLFISDTEHNRIVIASLSDYSVQEIIGGTEAGFVDGDYTTARFDSPQGLALVGETLYVADTENHAIRAIDLSAGTVTNAAGTGSNNGFSLTGGGATRTAMRSPWDLAFNPSLNVLYVAMAGSHQIWALALDDMMLRPFAGTSGEALLDGTRADSQMAQPSGLALSGDDLYFADSESSAIRKVGVGQTDEVLTVIGPIDLESIPARLFEFGDVDGGADVARLQHPLGVTVGGDGLVYITDTYNNKIKVIDPAIPTSTTFAGTGEGGYVDGRAEESQFYEPGGLNYADGKLYVADTNNHVIRVVDVAGGQVTTVIFPNVDRLVSLSSAAALDEGSLSDALNQATGIFGAEQLVAQAQTVAPGDGTILVQAAMPFGYKLNAQAPFTILWTPNDVVNFAPEQQTYQVVVPDLPIEIPVTFSAGQTEVTAEMTIYWCEAINETLCFVDRSQVTIPVTVSEDAAGSIVSVQRDLIPPDAGQGNTFGQ